MPSKRKTTHASLEPLMRDELGPPQPGRPTKLTPELTDFVVQLLKQGAFVDAACMQAGISDSTFYAWCRRGENGEEPFLDFLRAITEAQALAHNAVVFVAQAGATKDPALAMRWLQLRYPRRYGVTQVEVSAQEPIDFDEQRRRTLHQISSPEGRREISNTLEAIRLGGPLPDKLFQPEEAVRRGKR